MGKRWKQDNLVLRQTKNYMAERETSPGFSSPSSSVPQQTEVLSSTALIPIQPIIIPLSQSWFLQLNHGSSKLHSLSQILSLSYLASLLAIKQRKEPTEGLDTWF